MFYTTYHFDDGCTEGEFLTLDYADYADALHDFQEGVESAQSLDPEHPIVSIMVSDDTGYVHEFYAFLADCELMEPAGL